MALPYVVASWMEQKVHNKPFVLEEKCFFRDELISLSWIFDKERAFLMVVRV